MCAANLAMNALLMARDAECIATCDLRLAMCAEPSARYALGLAKGA